MKILSRSEVLAMVMVGTLVAGCSGGDGDGTSSSEEVAAPSGSPRPVRLFSDPITSGPRLDVFEVDGNIAVVVGGPIEAENDAAELRPDGSLVELYRSLHPAELQVPAELAALDELAVPALRALAASAPAAAPEASAAAESVEKTQSEFNATLCKTFVEGGTKYTPVKCNWKSNTNFVTNSLTLSMLAGDRAYAWNAASREGQIRFHRCLEGCDPVAVFDMPAFWWTWASVLAGGPYVADLEAKMWVANPGGERGITHHALSFIIR